MKSNLMNRKRLIGTAMTFAMASIIFYSDISDLRFMVTIAFVLGMSGMLFFRVFKEHALYFSLASGVAIGTGLILAIGWLATSIAVM